MKSNFILLYEQNNSRKKLEKNIFQKENMNEKELKLNCGGIRTASNVLWCTFATDMNLPHFFTYTFRHIGVISLFFNH